MKRSTTIAIGIAVALLILIGIPGWFSGLGFLAAYDTAFRILGPIFLIIGIPLLLTGAGYLFEKPIATGAGIVLTLGGAGYFIVGHDYLVGHKYAEDTVAVEEVTSYAERAPWNVTNSYAQRDQGDIIGDRDSVHYVPASQDSKAADGEGTSRYTTLVEARAFLGMAGYEAVQVLGMPITGTIPGGSSTYCEFPDHMESKLDTFWPWHSLSWDIHAKAPLAHWNTDDAYAYCAGDEPVVVVPLWEWDGFLWATKVPNGAAIYSSEGVQILSAEELVEEGIEGPTYPRTVAERQRDTINSGGSLADYWGKRYGYETTSKDSEDTNGENNTEFTLVTTGGEMMYVTPLTPRGSSQSITAVSEIPAQQSEHGREEIRINTSTDLPATSTIMTNIKESSVDGDNAWTTRWASGMSVYEVLPGKDGKWIASIGQGQAVSYRAEITPEGAVTVTNTERKSAPEDEESVTVESDKPLAEMSDSELLTLIQQATEELQEREANAG